MILRLPLTQLTRSLLVLVLLVITATFAPRSSEAQDRANTAETVSARPTTILLARHADRNGKADELTEAGTKRAQDLVRSLEKTPIDAVFHSEFARTAATAKPLCDSRTLTPQVIPAAETSKLIAELRREPGRTVLVVGHSNTVPEITKALGGAEFTIAENEFDDLIVVTIRGDEAPSVLRLQYGAPSP